MGIKNLIRALRLPFVSAGLFPFILGSLLARRNLNILNFLLGAVAAVAAHLSANLINDYADSKSGLDWHDKNFYKFFGGSKLIQEGVFSERFYFRLAVSFAALSAGAILLLALRLRSLYIIGLYSIILILAWSYSIKPSQFSYRMFGEFLIFALFGPALVMGGYFIQTKIFPDFKSFLLSLPFGFLTTAILFANEVPDFSEDKLANKRTWVDLIGQKNSFILYSLLMLFAFVSIGVNIAFGYLNPIAVISFVLILPAIRAAGILKEHFNDKIRLVESSQLTITVQALVGIVLILGVLL